MKYKLGEIFNLQMGKTPDRHSPKFWNEGTEPWISIDDLTKCIKYIENTAEKITATAVDESGIKIIPKNTVIMSFKLSIGKVAITPKEMYSNEAIMSFIDKGVLKIEPVYLYYLLMHKDWDTGTNKAVMGKTLNKASLSQMTVNIHGYSEQLEIIKALDTASSIITARKQQLQKLDELVKARFVELFGDPLGNDKGWQKALIAEVCNAIFGGGTPSKSHPEYFAGSIPWVSPKDMKSSVINDSIDHITEDAIAHSTTNLVPANSVLMVIRSGILKHTLPVAINSLPVTINQDMKAFVPNETVKTAFLLYFFKAIENDVLAGVRGVTADNIDFKAFQKRTIIVPPLALQEQFVAFVTQTDKSKVAVQKALDEAQLLFGSLMQKYFG